MSSGNAESSSVSTDSVATALGPLSPFTNGFSTAFAQPLKAAIPKTYPAGYAGSPRAFFNSVLISGASQISSCSSQLQAIDGSPCAYLNYLLYCLIIGIVVPIVTVLYCCGFLCARSCGERCRCCGSTCKQPNCGGRKPTVAKYPKWQTCCCGFSYLINWLLICAFAVLGFLSTNQTGQDIQLVLSSLNKAVDYADPYRLQMSARLNDMKVASLASLESSSINSKLAQIVPDASNSVVESIDKVSSLLSSLDSYCSALNCPTQPPDYTTFQNSTGSRVTFDQQQNAWKDMAGTLIPSATCCITNKTWSNNVNGSKYTADYYPNGDLKPAVCIIQYPQSEQLVNTQAGWACCRCVENAQRLIQTRSELQLMNSQVKALQKPIDPVLFGSAITALDKPINVSINAFQSAMKQAGTIIVQSSQALTNQAAIIGGSAALWAFAVLSSSFALFGLLFSITCCWWTSYCLGIINVIIFFIMFGIFALISLPFGDICTGLPLTGDTLTVQQAWLLTFSAQGRLADLSPEFVKMYTSCMIPPPPTGNLFLVASVDSKNLTQTLTNVAGDLKLSDATAALNVIGSFVSFSASIPYIQDNFTSSTLQSNLAAASSSIAQLKNKAGDTLAKLSPVIESRNAIIANTSSMIFSTGNCTMVNSLYEGFRGPLCTRMSKSLDSVWILFLLVGIAWFPMFLIICRSTKHTLIRKGIHENKLNEADLDIKELKQDQGSEEKGKQDGTPAPEGEKPAEGEKKKKKKKKKSEGGDDAAAPSSEEKQAALERKKKAK